MKRTLGLLAALLFAGAVAAQNREAGAASGQNSDPGAAAGQEIPAGIATGSTARIDEASAKGTAEASADGAASGKAAFAGIGAEQKPVSQSARNHAEGNPAHAAEQKPVSQSTQNHAEGNPAAAQSAAVDTTCVYCEIIAPHLPTSGNQVIFDFGQQSHSLLRYNMLQDDEGRERDFNSGIEALNFMVCRGWEFVQAFTSGEKNSLTHYLLRIAPEKLTPAQHRRWFTPPTTRKSSRKAKRK